MFKFPSPKLTKKNDTLFFLCVALAYSVVTLIAVLNHEPWRDEAQIWLIIRDLNIQEIFTHLTGNLCLWSLLLFPFVKLGFPYFSMQIIHWVISISATTLFLFKAPINKFTKVLFVFSYYMIFEYGVVARDYMLTILFLFLIANYYGSRFTNPKRYAALVFLLFNSHILGFGAAVALTIIYFIETVQMKKNSSYIPLIIMLCGLCVTIGQLSVASTSTVDATIPVSYFPKLNLDSAWTILTSIQIAFIPTAYNFEEIKMPLFFAFALCLYFFSLIRKPFVLFFLLISLSWLFYVFITKQYYWRYDGLILVFIIFTLWIKEYYQDKDTLISNKLSKCINYSIAGTSFNTFLVLCLLINVFVGINSIRKEYLYNFSGAKETAAFILEHQLQNSEFSCYQCSFHSLAAYLPNTKLWSVVSGRYETFFICDSVYVNSSNLPQEDAMNRLKEKYKKETLLLSGEPFLVKPDSSFQMKLMFQNEKFVWRDNNEKYFLYKVTFKE